MNRIVVPVDFSPSSAAAFRFAVKLSGATGMKVTVVYVFNSLVTTNLRESQEELAADREVLRESLEAFVQRHAGDESSRQSVEVVVAEGVPPVYIQWMSKEKDVALIVMGGIGTGSGGHRDIFGGIAKAISKKGGCPVVLIPEKFPDASMDATTGLLEGVTSLRSLTN